MTFCGDRSPRITVTLDRGTRSRLASSRRTASLARPSTAGSVTRMITGWSAMQTIWLRRARGCTRAEILTLATGAGETASALAGTGGGRLHRRLRARIGERSEMRLDLGPPRLEPRRAGEPPAELLHRPVP